MTKTIEELARIIRGIPVGREKTIVSNLTAIDEASKTSIAPFFRKSALRGIATLPGAVLTTQELAGLAIEAGIEAAITHENPAMALLQLVNIFYPSEERSLGVHPSAVVDPTAKIDLSASVGPLAVIESGVEIGAESVIGPRAVICRGTKIGKHVIVGPGSVIGSDGFGFAKSNKGALRIRHVGVVVVEDFVEIGANTCIDRATLGKTVIGEGSKLDNLVQVGHNARIGKGAFIAAQVGLAGSTTIGDGAMIGGQVGIADHLVVGAGAKIAAKSGVTKDVEAGKEMGGYPAVLRAKWLRSTAWLMRNAISKGKPEGKD